MNNKIINIKDSEINYYRKISNFKEGLALVQNMNYLYGFIDKNGYEVIPCIYNTAEDFSNGLAKVSNNDRLYGFIDKKGKEIIPFEYEYATNFNEEISYTIIQGKKYLINKENKRIPLNNYSYVGSISEGLILVNKNGLIGYIDKNGNEVIKPQYKNAFNFKEGLAVVENNEGLYGYIDKTGKIVIPLEYYFIHKITNNLYYTIENCKLVFTCGKGYSLNKEHENYINKNNEELELKNYSQINKLCEGLCLVKNNFDLYGYADETGKEVIPCKYILAGNFHDGLSYVMDIKGKFGFINKEDNEIIPCIYDKVEDFSEELAVVKKDNEIYVINTNNEVITSSKGYRTNIRIGNNETVIISRTKKDQNKEKIKLLNSIKEELLLETKELDNEIKKSRKLLKEDK